MFTMEKILVVTTLGGELERYSDAVYNTAIFNWTRLGAMNKNDTYIPQGDERNES